jgi:general secretion pathway protein L
MSHRVIGLDIGAASIKVAVIESSLRKFQLVEYFERPIPRARPDLDAAERRELEDDVLRKLKAEGVLDAETIVTALPGNKLAMRVLKLPFTDMRQIESTLGFELENFLPYSVDDIVYDYMVLSKGESHTELLATAVPLAYFEDKLAQLDGIGVDPRIVGVGPLSFLHLYKQLPISELEPIAFVDIGAAKTDILVLRGPRMELVRTHSRGGDQVSQAIAEELGVEWSEAERIKLEEGLIAPEGAPFLDDRQQALSRAARRGVDPILSAVLMTLQAQVGQNEDKVPVKRIYLAGGTSRLRGLFDYMEETLGIPTESLDLAQLEWNKLESSSPLGDMLPKVLGIGLHGTAAGARDTVNFRRGTYAYKGDFEFIQGKLIYLVALGLLLLAVAGLRAWMRYDLLVKERDGQYVALADYSREVLGKEKDDFDAVLTALREVPAPETMSIFPAITATRAFYDLTEVMEEVKNTTRAEVLQMRGEVDSGAPSGAAAGGDPALPGDGEARLPGAGPLPPGVGPGGVDPLFPEGAPGAVLPPGPGQVQLPATGGADDRAVRLQELRAQQRVGTAEAAQSRAERLRTLREAQTARPVPQPVRGVSPDFANLRSQLPEPEPEPEPAAAEGAAGEEGAPAPEGEPGDSEKLLVELENLQINEETMSIKGEANSIEAVTLLEQRLKRHPCFADVVLEGTEKINFDRHRNWYAFRIAVKLECEAPEPEGGADARKGDL